MRIGIDLGGTKIEGAALAADGSIAARLRLPTPAHDYPGTIAVVADLVARLQALTGPAASVGVGIPGAISPATGLVKNANATWLIGRPLDRDLAAALGRPVRVANDANCFAVSEATDGAAAGAAVVFGVILGTGVGGGLVVHGRPLCGANAIAGEWGHNPLPWPLPWPLPSPLSSSLPSPENGECPGPRCYCGREGCIETFLSGPGLARDYATSRTVVPGDQTADRIDAVEIVALAETGEPRAEAALQRYESRLARALASVINLLDPDVIVLGGGLSNVDRLYRNIPGLWQQWVFSDRVDTVLRRNRHGDSSGVRGAAWLWPLEGPAEVP